MTWTERFWVVAWAAIAYLALTFGPFGQVLLWQGGFYLTVYVNDPDRRFDAIAAKAVWTETDGQKAVNGLVEMDAKQSREWGETEAVRLAIINVKSSGRSLTGWGELSRSQQRHVVVVGYQKDGAVVRKLFDIPESRSAIEMTVDLPYAEPSVNRRDPPAESKDPTTPAPRRESRRE
jgi:hypothetical protein